MGGGVRGGLGFGLMGVLREVGLGVGRFLGVTRTVRVRPWRASWWVRSRSGSIWP
ncbi:hypothetical protein RHGRI_033758 [Rhododendron griersonianum]|uniref:Uncharacterized protein n=1 Tax=Rhododendron griersonianum TaxID=479676 RepID=A0AAV6I1C4_9ERIC|nr:hypothetical protein RHGRI_033758 [Rhododendron griersonianum]